MPIKNNNQEIIGAFQVLNKASGVFTKNDEDLLVAIGGSASIALENAQLFEQQKELYKEQKNSGTIHNANRKVGRNDPCPCGSGKKYKQCCGR